MNNVPIIQKRWWDIDVIRKGVSLDDILFFTKHLSIGLKTGLTLLDGLEMLRDQSVGTMKEILVDIVESVKSGQPFYKALERHSQYFPSMYVSLVETAEHAGRLEENLNYLAEDLLKDFDMRRKIRGAMAYPAIVLVLIIVLAVVVSIFIMPKITPVFESFDIELPLATRVIIFITDTVKTQGILVGIACLAIYGIARFLYQRNVVKAFIQSIILKLPIIGDIVKKVYVARFSRSIVTLLSSGITLDHGLKISASSTNNLIYKKAILSFIVEIEKGKQLATAMSYYPSLFPILSTRMIAMGEQTGSLTTTLQYLTEFYENEVDSTLKNLSVILEPILLIFIGGMVGVLALAILGPFLKLQSSI